MSGVAQGVSGTGKKVGLRTVEDGTLLVYAMHAQHAGSTLNFYRSSASGQTSASCMYVRFTNVGASTGTVMGVPVSQGRSVEFPALVGRYYQPIAFDGSGTVFEITEVR